jgi:hypothetical protein
MIGTTAIGAKRGIQRDRSQIRVSKTGRVHTKQIVLKMRGITGIEAKRGTQWDKSQISVLAGPLYIFFYSCRVIRQPE